VNFAPTTRPHVPRTCSLRTIVRTCLFLVAPILSTLVFAGTETPEATTGAPQKLRVFLTRWNDAMAAQDAPTIRASYVADDRLRWFEDGALRYRTREEILRALSQFPAGTRIETTLAEIEGEWLTAKLIQGSARFRTRVTMPGHSFEYGGVFTLVIERDGADWRFLRGHTSTVRPERGR
jgi:hypothetical protein